MQTTSDENGNGLPNYDSIFGPPSYEEATKHITIDTNEVVRSRNIHTKKLFRKYLICLLIPLTIGIIVYLYFAAVDLNRLVAEKERMNIMQVQTNPNDLSGSFTGVEGPY